MKQSLDRLAQISADKITEKNYQEVARAIWFELNRSKRISAVDVLIEKIRVIYEASDSKLVAEITSRDTLNEEQLELIKKNLEKKFKCNFYIETKIDKSIIGGLRIKIEDEIIDLSIRGQLSQLKERLAGEDE